MVEKREPFTPFPRVAMWWTMAPMVWWTMAPMMRWPSVFLVIGGWITGSIVMEIMSMRRVSMRRVSVRMVSMRMVSVRRGSMWRVSVRRGSMWRASVRRGSMWRVSVRRRGSMMLTTMRTMWVFAKMKMLTAPVGFYVTCVSSLLKDTEK